MKDCGTMINTSIGKINIVKKRRKRHGLHHKQRMQRILNSPISKNLRNFKTRGTDFSSEFKAIIAVAYAKFGGASKPAKYGAVAKTIKWIQKYHHVTLYRNAPLRYYKQVVNGKLKSKRQNCGRKSLLERSPAAVDHINNILKNDDESTFREIVQELEEKYKIECSLGSVFDAFSQLDGIHYSAKPKPVINDKTKEKRINHFTKNVSMLILHLKF